MTNVEYKDTTYLKLRIYIGNIDDFPNGLSGCGTSIRSNFVIVHSNCGSIHHCSGFESIIVNGETEYTYINGIQYSHTPKITRVYAVFYITLYWNSTTKEVIKTTKGLLRKKKEVHEEIVPGSVDFIRRSIDPFGRTLEEKFWVSIMPGDYVSTVDFLRLLG